MAYYCDDVYEEAVLVPDVVIRYSFIVDESALIIDSSYESGYSFGDESAVITSWSDGNIRNIVEESASITSVVFGGATFADVLTSTGIITGDVLPVFGNTVLETAVIGAAITEKHSTVLYESAVITNTVTQYGNPQTLVAETAVATGEAVATNGVIVLESAVITDTLSDASAAANTVNDTAVITSSVVEQLSLVNIVSDSAVVTSSASSVTQGGDIAYEVGFLIGSAFYGGAHTAWAADVGQLAMSRYDGLVSKEIAKVKGRTIGFSPEGAVEFGSDIPVEGFVLTGKSDMSAPGFKTAGDVFISGEFEDPLELTVYVDNKGVDAAYSYDFQNRRNESTSTNRVTLGKGIRSRYWQFKFANPSGGNFALRTAAADIAVANRRI